MSFSTVISPAANGLEGSLHTRERVEQDRRGVLKETEEQLCQVDLQIQQWKEHLLQQYNIEFEEINKKQCSDEVSVVLKKIHKQEQLKWVLKCLLKEAQLRDESAVVMQTWQNKKVFLSSAKSKIIPVGTTPLYSWYLKLMYSLLISTTGDVQNPQKKGKVLSVSDRLCYNLKYDTCQSSVWFKAENKKKAKELQQLAGNDWLEMLTFSTRRNGVCVNITATKFDRSKMECEQRQGTRNEYMCDDTQYIICFDPHISQALERSFTESLLQRQEPSAFITNSIWPIIDLLQS
ncbi:uncharacterized protein LOC144636648 [Oculina patagonica]